MKNIAIAVVLLVILGGIWMLGTTEFKLVDRSAQEKYFSIY